MDQASYIFTGDSIRKKSTSLLVVNFLLIFSIYSRAQQMPEHVKKLLNAYPQKISGFKNNHLIFYDGSFLQWNDSVKNKSENLMFDSPDCKDQFYFKYTVGKQDTAPKKNEDPGRIRNEKLFAKLYGTSRAEIEKDLVKVTWLKNTFGKEILFNKRFGAASALQKVADALDLLPDSLKKFCYPIGGTYNRRKISGTNRMSAHGYGISIDINVKYSHYWRWSKKRDDSIPYRNSIPQQIIDVFEQNGFIWGGKWYHYDTMHFEYRPELL